MSNTPRTEEALIDNADLSDEGWGKSEMVHADFARKLETENARLREALKPFVRYAVAHGAVNLCGRNGAYLKAEDWMTANEALANAGGEPRSGQKTSPAPSVE